MPIAVQLNNAERVRRAKAAEPSLSEAQLAEKFGVTLSQVKAALAYKQPGRLLGRKRA